MFHKFLCGLMVFGAVALWGQSPAKAAPVNVMIARNRGQMMVNVKVKRRLWRRFRRRGGKFVIRAWLRDSSGWKKVRRFRMRRRRFARTVPMTAFCRPGEYGRKRLAIQVGYKLRGFWFNRFARRYQQDFVAIRQDVEKVRCGRMPRDLPPGSPPNANVNDGHGADTPIERWRPPTFQRPPSTPPSTTPPSTPPSTPPHRGDDHGDDHGDDGRQPPSNPPSVPPSNPPSVPPSNPPPPQQQMVPEVQARRFARSLKQQSFDNNRISMLKSWLQTARRSNSVISWRAVRRFLKLFTYDTSRVKVSRALSKTVMRPLRAAEVAAIIKTCSYDSNKFKLVKRFCRGLADPLNASVIANEFSYGSYKQKVMKVCR